MNFKEAAGNFGLDVCYLILSLCQAWLKSLDKTESIHQITTATQVINLQQQNIFIYNVQKPRREPPKLICSRKVSNRTLSSLAFQAYVLEKARDMQQSFSFRDFPELGHNFFRKCILRLKERGKILPLKPRSNPRFYILTEWLSDYPTMKKNNRVKPRFTRPSLGEMNKRRGKLCEKVFLRC